MTLTLDDTPLTETVAEQRASFLADQLEAASNTIELLEESLASIELAREDAGWKSLIFDAELQFSRAGLRQSAQLCRILAISNPLIKRGISLRTSYIWGGGVQVAARATGNSTDNPNEQDVNAVVQAFLEDPDTLNALWGVAARIRNERALATDGNIITALWTDRATGKVRPRLIPFDEIQEVISNPEDSMERWFFLRQYTVQVRESGTLPGTERLRTETRRVLYPSIDYRPARRPKTHAGVPIEWDAPVAEMAVNRFDTWDFGVGDAFGAIEWARAYSGLLTDWAKYIKALSRFAFRATADRTSKARKAAATQRAAQQQTSAAASLPAPRGTDPVGGTVHLGPGQNLERIGSGSGATVDAGAGRPLAAMVASNLDIPVTMLLGDPGVTGARATAETLDKPTELMAQLRRDEWAAYLRRVLDYVIDKAARAPAGPLKAARIVRDNAVNRETVILAGDTDRTIEVSWPDLSETPLKELVDAIVAADGTDKVPGVVILKQLLNALHVADMDEIVEKATDDDGNLIDPSVTAGDQAVKAFRNGEDPAEAIR